MVTTGLSIKADKLVYSLQAICVFLPCAYGFG